MEDVENKNNPCKVRLKTHGEKKTMRNERERKNSGRKEYMARGRGTGDAD